MSEHAITIAPEPSPWASMTTEQILASIVELVEQIHRVPPVIPPTFGDVEVLCHDDAPDGLVLVASDELTAKVWRRLQEGEPGPLPVIVRTRPEDLRLVIPPTFTEPPGFVVTLRI